MGVYKVNGFEVWVNGCRPVLSLFLSLSGLHFKVFDSDRTECSDWRLDSRWATPQLSGTKVLTDIYSKALFVEMQLLFLLFLLLFYIIVWTEMKFKASFYCNSVVGYSNLTPWRLSDDRDRSTGRVNRRASQISSTAAWSNWSNSQKPFH